MGQVFKQRAPGGDAAAAATPKKSGPDVKALQANSEIQAALKEGRLDDISPRARLMLELADCESDLWEHPDLGKVNGLGELEMLDLGGTVVTHQKSKISTDYDGDSLPKKWDPCYRDGTTLHVENLDPARQQVGLKSDKALSEVGTSRAAVLESANQCSDRTAAKGNRPEFYQSTTAPVGAQVDLTAEERYAVVNGRLNQELGKRLGNKRGVMGAGAIVSDPKSGDMTSATTGDVGPKGSSGEVAAATRKALPHISGSREDSPDAADFVFMHRRGKEQPVQTTEDVSNLDSVVDKQILNEVIHMQRAEVNHIADRL